MAATEKAAAIFQADERDLVRGINRAERELDGFGRKTKKTLGKGASQALGGFGGAVGLGGMLAGPIAAVGGLGAAAGFAVNDALDFDDALVSLDIASSGAAGSMDKIRRRTLEVSKAWGVSKEELLAGASAFVALTGDGAGAMDSMEAFAKTQLATKASMEDIARTAAALRDQLHIDPSEMESAFSIIVAAGKAGAVEMKDMAGLMSELAASFKKFDASEGAGGLATLSAALQAVMKDAGTAGEAATMLDAFMGSIVGSADKLQKMGINVFDKDPTTGVETLKSLPEILDQMANSKLVKSPRFMKEVFPLKEARKGAEALMTHRRLMDEIAAGARNAGDVGEDAAKRQASASGRVKKLWNEVKVAVSEAFSGEVMDVFASALEGVAGLIGKILSDMAELARFTGELAGSVVNAATDSMISPDQAFDMMLKKEGSIEKLAGRDDEIGNMARRRMARQQAFAEQDRQQFMDRGGVEGAAAFDAVAAGQQDRMGLPAPLAKPVKVDVQVGVDDKGGLWAKMRNAKDQRL